MDQPPPAGSAAAALEALPFALAAFAPDGTLVLHNAALRVLLGPGEPAAIGAGDWHGLLRCLAFRGVLGDGAPDERAAEFRPLAGAAGARTLRTTDGRLLDWFQAPMPAGGWLAGLMDSAARHAAREAAEAAAREAAEILAQLETGIARFDAGRRLARVNPAFARLTGTSEAVLRPGAALRDLLDAQVAGGEFPTERADALERQFAAGPPQPGTPWRVERTRPSGATIRFSNHPMPDGGWLSEVADISAERAAGEEARRRAALYDALIQALPVGVAVYGADRRVRMVNAAYNRILADDPVEIGESLPDILLRRAQAGEFGPGEPEAHVAERMAALHFARSFERRRPGGGWSLHQLVPLPDGGHAMVVSDVTALQAAQAEARERAQVLDTMLESTRHGIVLFDAEGRVVAANRLAARLSGVPAEAFTPGVSIHSLRAEQVKRGVFGDAEATRRFLDWRGAEPLRTEDTYRRPGPGGTVVEVATDALPDGGFVRSYTDVTALTRAEEEAKRRADTLGTVLDTMRHGVIMYDADGYVLAANRLAERLAGLPEGSARPGVHFDDLRGIQMTRGEHGDAEATARYLRNRVREPWAGESTYQRRRPDGTLVEVRTDLIPGGGCVRSFTDITALAAAQEESVRRAALLQVMMDNIRHGLVLFDAAERVVAYNALGERLMGLEGRLSVGMPRGAILAIQAAEGEFGDAEAAAAYLAAVAATDWSRTGTLYRRRWDGTEIEAVTNPVPGGGFVLTLSDVTDRVRAEREARSRATLLEAALNAARTGIALYGPDGRVVAANDLAARIAGLPRAESLVGLGIAEVVAQQSVLETDDPDAQARDLATYAEGLDRRRAHHYERRRPDGTVLDVRSDPTPDGGFVVSLSDVTELVEAREAAWRQAATLASALNATRHAITLYGPEGRVVAANGIAAELAGFAGPAAMDGLTFEQVMRHQLGHEFAGDAAGLEATIGALLAVDRRSPQRYQRRRTDGRVLDVTSDPTPEGGFAISVSDVTPLLEAQEDAQRRAAILSAMLGNIRHGIAMFDREGRIVASNARLHEMLGLTAEALAPGRTMEEMVDALLAAGEYGAGEEARRIADDIKSRDRTRSIRTTRMRRDGSVFEVVSDPTPDGGWVVTYSDVTEDRRIRGELERARAAAEAANLAKSRFLATMSHELRTPLNAVIGFSEVLQGGPEAQLVPEYAAAIHEAGRHLLTLIDDILDITRAEEGRLPVGRARVELAPLLHAASRVMAGQAEAAGIRLETEEPPAGLPALMADERRLRQVLMNLLSNAIKFSPRGGTVALSAVALADGGVALEVADTGIGIAKDDMGRLFQPFAQVENEISRRFAGSGLGLYLSRVLVEAMGGTLELESEAGQGTLARVAFPPHLLAP